MTEQLPFSVVKRYADFEVRHYPDYLLAQTEQTGDFVAAGYRGFQPLFQFITGRNEQAQKIAMTAPVLQREKTERTHSVAFVMPATMKREDMPQPNDPSVTTEFVLAHDVAVITFRGSWSEKLMREKAALLTSAVRREGLTPGGDVYVARFDPPWKPGFMKKNEVLLDLI